MIAVIGFGLGQVFIAYPLIYEILKYAGSAYMLWLAYKIATAAPASHEKTDGRQPLTFMQGALFQWINPKGWAMGVTALSAYTVHANYYAGVAAIVVTFMMMGLTSASGWVLFGTGLRQVMTNPKWFRIINLALAMALVLSLVPMLYH
jgi:threonine/homoserine/homoserine lactone efflux protein